MHYPEPDFVIRTGDNAPRIVARLTDAEGAQIDATGATVALHLTPLVGVSDNDPVTMSGSVAEDGTVFYDWTPGDTADPGWYGGVWQVTFDGGQRQSFPNEGWFIVRVTP